MTTIVAATPGPSRDDWLQDRKRGIGASDAAAVVGLHPWVSPLALFYDKTGQLVVDEPPTEAMEWGLRLEPVVAQAWAEKNGRRLRRFEPYDPAARYTHPDLPWMVASLDGIVLDDYDQAEAVYEGKTASGWSAADWDEGVPGYIYVQVQHQLAVTGLPVAHVACLVGGSRYLQETVERDDETISALIESETRFWRAVEAGGPPPLADSHPSTGQVLKARWDETLAEAVDLGEQGLQLVRQRHHAKRAADTAATDQAEAENRLRQLLADHEVGTVYGEIAATWRQDKNGNRRLIVKEI
jgi:putative phage-type endonuclease